MLYVLIVLSISVSATAESIDTLAEIGSKCSGLPTRLIKSVIYVESKGNPYAVNINGVGGYQASSLREALRVLYHYDRANSDLGLMQVNYLTWGPVMGLTPVDLLRPSTNVCVGSVILREYIDAHGGWKGVGRYNAATPSKQRAYILKVASAYGRISD